MQTERSHIEFYKTIKRIAEGDFVLSSSLPINHIASLQNKLDVFKETELKRRDTIKRNERLLECEIDDRWLNRTLSDLLDSGCFLK